MPKICLSHDERSLLAIVRNALNGDDCRLEICPTDYQRVMRMAEEQAVQGLLLDGVVRMPKEMAPPLPMLLKLTGVVCGQMENINRRHIDVIGKMSATLEDAGIKAVFMKGQTTGRRWSAPLHRTPGDVDFLVEESDYQRTLDVLESIGEVDRTLRHEHHGMAFVDGVQIEPHYKIHNYQCPWTDRRMNGLASSILKDESCKAMIGDKEINVLPATFESVFLISHIVNHIYEEGLGLRQLVDYAMLLRHEHGNIDWERHNEWLEQVRMMRAWRIVVCLCQDYLGAERHWEFTEKEHERAGRLMRDVMAVGNFGRAAYTFRHDTIWHKLRNYRWVVRRAWRMGFVCPNEALWWPVSKMIRFTKK